MAKQEPENLVVPVILCGGAGCRLWPLSRPDNPKPFLPLTGSVTSFAATLKRVADQRVFAKPIIVAAAAAEDALCAALKDFPSGARIVLEPVSRNSAVAIAIAAEVARAADEDPVLLVLPADHLIDDDEAFVSDVVAALPLALTNLLVTFGHAATEPAPAFGYILPGEALHPAGHRVARFVEKPTVDGARQLIAQGASWNSGNFLMKASVAQAELRAWAPEVAVAVDALLHEDGLFIKPDAEALACCPSVSFDVAVMEKTGRAVVAGTTHAWKDIGTWLALWQVSHKDANGNVISGPATLTDTRGSYVTTTGPRTVVVGLEDVVVAVTPDAVLVTRKQQA